MYYPSMIPEATPVPLVYSTVDINGLLPMLGVVVLVAFALIGLALVLVSTD